MKTSRAALALAAVTLGDPHWQAVLKRERKG